MYKQGFSWKRHKNSYRWAIQGFLHTLKTQSNIWVQLPVGIFVLFLAYLFSVEKWEWAALILVVGMVISAELMNTAVEAMMNVVQKKYDLDVKVAKDVAAGSVLVCAIVSVIVGWLILYPYFFDFLTH